MNGWMSVRKGSTHLHVSYGHTFSNNLSGYDTQIRVEPTFEIRLDLSPNLRTRSKQSNTYLDARDLADGEIARLKLLQVYDDRLLEAIARSMRRLSAPPRTWTLTLFLSKEWSFVVTPELRAHSLLLHVQSLADESAQVKIRDKEPVG